ncbi:MAG: hypothetical protein IJX22_02455 [Opitutales bacterium]|nr:hypothetical protein [Opitutales bacterium]
MKTGKHTPQKHFISPICKAHFVFQLYTSRRPVRQLARECGLSGTMARKIFKDCEEVNAFPRREEYTPPPVKTGTRTVFIYRLAAVAEKLATRNTLKAIAEKYSLCPKTVRDLAPIRAKLRRALVGNFPEMGSLRKK